MGTLSDGYEPRFDIDRARGERGERMTDECWEEIGSGRTEVKTDDKAVQTRRLYIEHACRGRDGVWRESGILTTEAKWWVIVVGQLILGAPTEVVLEIHMEAMMKGRFLECSRGSNPTKGVYVPLHEYIARISAVARP